MTHLKVTESISVLKIICKFILVKLYSKKYLPVGNHRIIKIIKAFYIVAKFKKWMNFKYKKKKITINQIEVGKSGLKKLRTN